MRHELPRHPHIDHLKKQAKDLLDGHRRGDAEALARIVASLPAFARVSEKDAARAPFALHDAQSVVAREYGFPSWRELRAEIERRGSQGVPDSLLRALAGTPSLGPDRPAAIKRFPSGEMSQRHATPAPPPAPPRIGARNSALGTPG